MAAGVTRSGCAGCHGSNSSFVASAVQRPAALVESSIPDRQSLSLQAMHLVRKAFLIGKVLSAKSQVKVHGDIFRMCSPAEASFIATPSSLGAGLCFCVPYVICSLRCEPAKHLSYWNKVQTRHGATHCTGLGGGPDAEKLHRTRQAWRADVSLRCTVQSICVRFMC